MRISATGRRSFSLRHTPPKRQECRDVLLPQTRHTARQRSSGFEGALATLQQPRAMCTRAAVALVSIGSLHVGGRQRQPPSPRVLQQALLQGSGFTLRRALQASTRSSPQAQENGQSPPTSVGSVPVGSTLPQRSQFKNPCTSEESIEAFQEYEYLVVPLQILAGSLRGCTSVSSIRPTSLASSETRAHVAGDVSSSSLFHGAEDADDFVDSGASVDVGESPIASTRKA